jgi:hypothetical protein
MKRLIVHLVGGGRLRSARLTSADEAEARKFEQFLRDNAKDGEANWELNLELRNGNQAIIPGRYILFMEIER